MKRTGKLDINGVEIKEGQTVRVSWPKRNLYKPIDYIVKYGIGTYDSGVYTYLGFYLVNKDDPKNINYSDGTGFFFDYDKIENEDFNLEVINQV